MTEFCSQNLEINDKTPYFKSSGEPKRVDVLLALWNNHIRLQELRTNLAEGKIHPSEKLRQEIYIIQVDCQAIKIAAYVLKDSELEVLAHDVEELKKLLGKNR